MNGTVLHNCADVLLRIYSLTCVQILYCGFNRNILNEKCNIMARLVVGCLIGFTEWGDDTDVLAQVIAQSQHEYLASLKKSSVPKNSDFAAGTSLQGGPAKNGDVTVPNGDKGKSPMPKDRHV